MPTLASILLLIVTTTNSTPIYPGIVYSHQNSHFVNSSVSQLPPVDSDEALKKVWQTFTADGRYRMATVDDMKFSDAMKQKLSGRSWAYANTVGFRGEHAVIVIDTSRSDDARLGIIIFRPADRLKKVYKVEWLLSGCDLSKATISHASSNFFVTRTKEDGTEESCEVIWSPRLKKYRCRIRCNAASRSV